MSAIGLLPHGSSQVDAPLLAASVLAGGVVIFVLIHAVRRLPPPMPFVRSCAGVAPGGAFPKFQMVPESHGYRVPATLAFLAGLGAAAALEGMFNTFGT